MRGILEFELPEEQEAFELAQFNISYKVVVEDFDIYLRNLAKYTDQTSVTIEEARKKLHELLEEYL